ncbi:uncharacterized protein LOC141619501 [Silene latifolia]|uniref:uncharacterized protein LOC141619501 n=1 Tax=Silene latifolia TaxID=37657 RepID=UPI003D788320
MDGVRKAVVVLIWTNKNKPTSGYSQTTGFIYKKNDEGLFILSTSHQFMNNIFENLLEMPKSQLGVRVEFFDRTTIMDADVLHFDMVKDLTLITVKSCDELKTHPIDCIEPIPFSMDPPNCSQDVYTFHHPVWFNIATCKQEVAYFQYTEGFIVYNFTQNSGVVSYYMPLIFPGSSGAPVVNKNSKRLVSMFEYQDSLRNVHAGTNAGTMSVKVYRGPTVSVIQQFLNEAETPNPSTTESGQSGDAETDTNDVVIGC